ncbi:hypothetical protein FORMB_04820 [Formosa sp. Hel1_33_131]|uniref:hypothetical protein n=1 Tax=Formosa sp. Hel1_33_131 TaxID=1336794 RepID=UPI00084E12AA|nr:hypothetical protein [Formosa sp. Hel1_33_131]AOR27536.1 hypothetical protein FORMB_04820 [Formosa sp. Hel1_33_131]
MDVIGIFIVHYIFSFLGASLRYVIINSKNIFLKKEKVGFKYIWEGKGGKYNGIESETVNTLIGFVLFFVLATLIIKYNW